MGTLVMGVINVTPDSFYDGGRYVDHDAAIEHGLELLSEGADILDVGGESSRPGAQSISVEEEIDRVLPVVRALSGSARVSIDTMKPEVANAALEAGATLVNDVSSTLGPVAAAHGSGIVVMHMQGRPPSMQADPHYADVVGEVRAALCESAASARALGVEEIYIDPGIGFGKTAEHNLELLAHLDVLVDSGWPVVVGTSRKSFLGAISSGVSGHTLPVAERLEGSLASAIWAMACGVAIVRVHDVRPTVYGARLVAEPARSGAR